MNSRERKKIYHKLLDHVTSGTSPNKVTHYQRLLLLKIYKYRCIHCKRSVLERNLTVDHWLPKSKGGMNNLPNLQLLCIKCHKEKTEGDELFSLENSVKVIHSFD